MEFREIKFRAWDEGNKKMHHNFQFISSGSDGNDWILFDSKEKPAKREKHQLIFDDPFFRHQLKVMQFTGLLINETEIFEGDVLHGFYGDVPCKWVVVFGSDRDNTPAMFCMYPILPKGNQRMDYNTFPIMETDFVKFSKKAGNIYEQPHLLIQ